MSDLNSTGNEVTAKFKNPEAPKPDVVMTEREEVKSAPKSVFNLKVEQA